MTIKEISKTSERLIPDQSHKTLNDRVMFLRHLFAYNYVTKNVNTNSHILDMGFGEGYGVAYLSSFFKSVIGLDIDGYVVLHANRKYKSVNCHYRLYDGEKIPSEDKTFDCVVSFQVIEHVKNDINYVQEILRVLNPGGKFILTTPNRALRLKPGEKPWNRFHLREYDAFDLKTLLKKVFKDVKIYGIFANQRIYEMEFNRLKTAKIISKLDIFNFNNKLPMGLRQSISNTLNYLFKFFQKREEISDPIKMEDFYVSDLTKGCLDLIAVCIK